MKNNPLVKTVQIQGKGREAQEHAQAVAVSEFMDGTMLPRYRMMLNFATGVGKGKVAIECGIRFYDEVSKKPMFIACYTESQRDNVWVQQMVTWGRLHHITQNYRAECYASMHNIVGQHFGLVVLDEAQHLTELSYSFFENNTFDAILILTATEPKDPLKKQLIKRLTYGRKLVIKADQAIDAGILNDFEIWRVQVELDTTIERKLFKNSNSLYSDYTGYLKHCQILTSAKRSGNSVRIKFAAIQRMRYVGNTLTKRFAAMYIQDQFREKDERFITIAASIEQANLLSPYTYHSETNDNNYKKFLHNQIDELISIKQIREGENFENLGRILMVQADKNANNTVQITGRGLRLPIGQMSKIFILEAMGTDDKGWVDSATADTNPNKIFSFHLTRDKYWKEPLIKNLYNHEI